MALFDSEDEFLSWLKNRLPEPGRKVPVGVGDDAAVLRASRWRDWLVTSDFSIEGVHFSLRWHPPKAVGHRALARSLSDIAAMGGKPRFALMSLAISKRLSRAWIEEFYDGLLSLAAHYGVAVVGGDTARVRGAAVADVTVLGEQASGQILRRSGARPGDLIFVSGRLGLGELGWRILRRQQAAMRWKLNPTDRAAALRAHLYPEPQCALGEFLARNGLASAAMDISDGLAKDLSRLAQASQVGALVEEARIPAPEFIPRDAAQRLALAGGEDYQLLFTVPPAKARRIPRAFRSATLHRIGSITGTGKLRLSRQNGKETDLEPLGYDHFRRE